MRLRLFVLSTVTLVCAQLASANLLCVSGTLAGYEALGAGGCTIGANTVSSFGTVSGFSGATPIDPTLVTITPSGGSANPALTFLLNQTASGGSALEAIFSYTISGSSFTSESITLSGSSETVDGAVTDTQNFCAGGTFGPDGVTGCNGSASGSLLALDGFQNTDQTTFSNPVLLRITDDLVLDSGEEGSASGGTFVDQFGASQTSSTPEPATFLLVGLGLALAALGKSRVRHPNL